MSNVKIKKSVLQSIIKKSLRESGLHSDPSRRLTVGPDTSTLPAPLPLTPGNRMSTQLDVERPPVEDPEYVPANRKELGLALQALAEIVPVDGVEEAYNEFQRTIERMEKDRENVEDDSELEDEDEDEVADDEPDEESDEIKSQMESVRRKLARIDRLLGEAPKARLRGQGGSDKRNDDPEALAALERMKDYKGSQIERDPTNRQEQMAAFGRWLARNKKPLAPSNDGKIRQFKAFLEDTKDPDASLDKFARGIKVDAGPDDNDTQVIPFKTPGVPLSVTIAGDYGDVIASFEKPADDLKMIMNLMDGKSITKEQLFKFFNDLMAFKDDRAFMKKVKDAISSGRTAPEDLAAFIQKFSDEKESSINKESEKDFSWRDQFKRFGYSAESGLRQSFISDVNARMLLRNRILPDGESDEINDTLAMAFKSAISNKSNLPLLKKLFDEDGLAEYMDFVSGADHDELLASSLYRNFIGAINRDIMSAIADFYFLGPDGKINKSRPVGLAFMQGWKDYAPPTPNEEKQLEKMATDGTYSDMLDEFLDEASSNNFRNVLTAATILTAQDMDAEEFGGYTEEPAFTSLRKHSGNKKVPDYALKDYIDPETPEGAEFLKGIKLANKESEQLAKARSASRSK